MKKFFPIIAVVISGLLLMWLTLLVNRIQRFCMDMGASDSADKVSLSTEQIPVALFHGQPLDLVYASAGGVLLLCLAVFVILAGTVLWMSGKPAGGKDS